jgi:hypothetical protein
VPGRKRVYSPTLISNCLTLSKGPPSHLVLPTPLPSRRLAPSGNPHSSIFARKTANPSPCPSKDRHLPTHSLYADQHPLAISALRSLRENVNCSKLSRERYGPRGDLASTSFVSHWLLTIVLVETIRSASVGREIPKTTPNWPETDH